MTTIALIGAPGSGKSTVGALLAERLRLPFFDVDTEIERMHGKLVREIFADDGEEAFRAIEKDATLSLLVGDGVVSLGGGAPMTPAIADALADVQTVWLMVDAHDAFKRVGLDDSRPLLAGGGIRATLIKMLRARTPVYAAVGRLHVDTSGREPGEVVEEIIALLQEPAA
ncbi:shikimate kinase [Propioniciclava sp. MC1683]|uniref:shikimate kinase n=1 Tax=Propioniciclava sp. MC1683 TaxID=2760309 RepID=UPI0028158032|nr:shikimate kinase [Propioniciclava sp. MC1683]